ncbi:MAG TPA: hypothetical protein VJH37_00160 [Candidatus Nanoarchaeia archaeon]|nr:hypothetical protein [Candidatus Nanoarchaeia archaeon]
MNVVIDACSIILLAKSSVLETLAKWRKIIVTEGVYNEVLEGKNKKFLDALLLDRLVGEKKISIEKKLKKEVVQKLTNDFGLGIGEAESITLALESNALMITDNKQGRKAAKVQGLSLIGSIETVTALYKTKRIDKEKAINTLKILKRVGWFQDYLIEEAMGDVQNG